MVGSDSLNPRYIKAEVEVRREVIVKEIIRIGTGQTIDQIVGIGNNSDTTEIDPDLSKVIDGVVFKIIPEDTIYKIEEESIGIIVIEMVVITEGSFSGNYGDNRTRSMSKSRLRSGSRASTKRDRIRCYNCREYDHFARDCPTSREEGDID